MSDSSNDQFDDLRATMKACISLNRTNQLTLAELSREFRIQSCGDRNLLTEVINRGYTSILSFLKNDPDTFKVKEEADGTIKVGLSSNLVDSEESRGDADSDHTIVSPSDDENFWNVPSDLISCEPKFPLIEQKNPKFAEKDPAKCLSVSSQTHNILIVESLTPERFWFVTCDEAVKIEALIKSMTKYYQQGSDERAEKLEVDDFVAVLYNGTWNRAKVLELDEEMAKILYVDLGSTDLVDVKSQVLRLRQQFIDEPLYIKRGSLVGSGELAMTAKSMSSFKELVKKSSMKAEVCDFDPQQRVHYMKVHIAENVDGKEENLIDLLKTKCVIRSTAKTENSQNSTNRMSKEKSIKSQSSGSSEKPVFKLRNTNAPKNAMEMPKSKAQHAAKTSNRPALPQSQPSNPIVTAKDKQLVLKSSGHKRQIFPVSLSMFKENQTREIVVHVIDEASLDFKFFIKEDFDSFREFDQKLNELYKQNHFQCNDFTIGSDVVVYHDKSYCRGRITRVSQVGAVEIELLDFGFPITRSHDEVFRLDFELFSKRPFIFPGCLNQIQMGKIDYEMFRSVTKNKIVKSMVTGKVGTKVEFTIKELLDIVAVEE